LSTSCACPKKPTQYVVDLRLTSLPTGSIFVAAFRA
jgi:hypothetical protein